MNGVRIGICLGMMLGFGVIAYQLTNGELLLTVTGWLTFLGG